MLKRSLPPTPTHILSFDLSIRSTPSPTSCGFSLPSSPISSSNSSGSNTRHFRQAKTLPPRKRRRSSPLDSDAVRVESDLHISEAIPRLVTPSNTQTESSTSANDAMMTEMNIAGPSRFASKYNENENLKLQLAMATSSSMATKVRKRPAKLALQSSTSKSDTLQVKEVPVGSRSVPSSPIVYKVQGQNAVSADTQLRDSLRGTPRRRPSVPFGLRIDSKLPLLSIPVKSAGLKKEGLPSIWQDPSEHILSGNGSSLQHARSVYASGPIEVLPGLFLGDEFNACDDVSLARLGITTIINVAKETTLPFQEETFSEQVDFTPSLNLHQRIQNVSLTDASSLSSMRHPMTSTRETFFTPDTSLSSDAGHLPLQSPMSPANVPSPSFYIRDVSSTPNLLASFTTFSPDPSLSPTSSIGSAPSSPELQEGLTPQLLHRYSSTNMSTTTPSSNGAETLATSATSFTSPPLLMLPDNAIALNVAPSPQTGRPFGLKYIKLPWTHDETELAGNNLGGFMTGCALIAKGLGIDFNTGIKKDLDGKQGVLVHCQCGVSRSATLVIAFVMQAAAYNFEFEKTKNLTGMHDCYEMVKELSSSISPNCNLIYQLVEWERQLSKHVTDRASMESKRQADPSALTGDKRWGNDAMNEEDWTRMRREEERKERIEEEKMKDERLALNQLQSHQQQLTVSSSPPSSISSSSTGIGARRRRMTPSLNLVSSARAAADEIVKEQRQSSANMEGDSAILDIPPGLLELESGQQHLTPLATGHFTLQRNHRVSPLLISPPSGSSNGSGTSTLHAINSPLSNGGHFGVNTLTAAERRNKHKRTFSKEIPNWNRKSITSLTVPKVHPSAS